MPELLNKFLKSYRHVNNLWTGLRLCKSLKLPVYATVGCLLYMDIYNDAQQ